MEKPWMTNCSLVPRLKRQKDERKEMITRGKDGEEDGGEIRVFASGKRLS